MAVAFSADVLPVPVALATLQLPPDGDGTMLLNPARVQDIDLKGGSLTSKPPPTGFPPSGREAFLWASATTTTPPFNPVQFAQNAWAGGGAALESAITQLTNLARTAPQLAKPAVESLMRAAGGATALARAAGAQSANALRALGALAAAVSLAELAVACTVALGVIGLTAQPAAGPGVPQDRQHRGPPFPLPAATSTRQNHVPATVPSPSQVNVDVAPVEATSLPIVNKQMSLAREGYAQSGATSQLLARAYDLLPDLNTALRQFYFDAAGGAAARIAKLPQAQVTNIEGLRGELNTLVKTSNAPLHGVQAAAQSLRSIVDNAANNPYLAPDVEAVADDLASRAQVLSGRRDQLKSLVVQLDSWLAQAHKFVADGRQELPALPSMLLVPAGGNATTVEQGLENAWRDAQTKLAPTVAPSEARVEPDATSNGKPGRLVPYEVPISQTYPMDGRPPGHGGGPRLPKIPLGPAVLTASIVGATVYGLQQGEEQKQISIHKPDFKDADAEAAEILARLSPNSSDNEIRSARQEIWRSYLEVANKTLDGLHWQPVLGVIPVLGGGKMFTPADMTQLRDAQNDFVQTLYPQPPPSKPGGTTGSFSSVAAFDGDAYKTHHANHVLALTSKAAEEKVASIASRTSGDQKVLAFGSTPFNVDAYFASHKATVATAEGRREALVAIYEHHLNQIPLALGSARVNAEERTSFERTVKTWLAPPSSLDPNNLAPLPLNADIQALLRSALAAAAIDIERLGSLVPVAKQTPLQQVFGQSPPPGVAPNGLSERAPPVMPAAPNTRQTATAANATPRPSASAQQPLTARQAIDAVAEATHAAKLTSPPDIQSFAEMRFTPEMFFGPGEPKTGTSIAKAYARAAALYTQFDAIYKNTSVEVAEGDFKVAALDFYKTVLQPLSTLHAAPVPAPVPDPVPTTEAAPPTDSSAPVAPGNEAPGVTTPP